MEVHNRLRYLKLNTWSKMLKIRKLQNKNSIVKEIGILTKQGFNNRLKTLIGE